MNIDILEWLINDNNTNGSRLDPSGKWSKKLKQELEMVFASLLDSAQQEIENDGYK